MFSDRRTNRTVELKLKLPILARILAADAIEFLSGLRAKQWNFIASFLATIVLAFVGQLLIEPVRVIAWSLIIGFFVRTVCGFYATCESSLMIQSFPLSATKFLLRKLRIGITNLTILLAPTLITAACLLPSHWLLWCLLLLASEALLVQTVLLKYASFKEGANRWLLSEIGFMLGVISVVLFPAYLLMQYYLTKRAVRFLDQLI